jgi:chromosome segregation ATPase
MAKSQTLVELRERCRKLLAANLRLKRQLIARDAEIQRLNNELGDLNEAFMNEAEEAEGLRHKILAAQKALGDVEVDKTAAALVRLEALGNARRKADDFDDFLAGLLRT